MEVGQDWKKWVTFTLTACGCTRSAMPCKESRAGQLTCVVYLPSRRCTVIVYQSYRLLTGTRTADGDVCQRQEQFQVLL